MTARLRDVPAGVAFRTLLLRLRGAVVHHRGHKTEVYMAGRHMFVSPSLVTVAGAEYQITDIGLRMIQPHELLAAQFGRFAAGYDLTAAKAKTAQVRLVGNSVFPEVAEALVRSNLPGASREEAAA